MFKIKLKSKSPQKNILKYFLYSKFYKNPKTLPYLHTFYKKYLLKNIQNKTTNLPKKYPIYQKTFNKTPKNIYNNILLQN